ncbi:MAG: TlpA disulfide reductase family protein [Candidatus Woesearchaeota archaeon]|nr:TlpA disulfide reductase family protein [Candidatus Woesearchaeota archaeon]
MKLHITLIAILLVLAACQTGQPTDEMPVKQAEAGAPTGVAGTANVVPADEPMDEKPMDEEPMDGESMDKESMDEETAAVETPKNAAPDFTVTTSNGDEFALAQKTAEGRPVVVYFMASWCGTCAKNWAALNEVYPAYEGQVDFVAVSVDPTDSAEVLTELSIDKGFVFETSPGNTDLALDYDVTKQTAKFAISADGAIVERHDGALDEAGWDAFFAQLV